MQLHLRGKERAEDGLACKRKLNVCGWVWKGTIERKFHEYTTLSEAMMTWVLVMAMWVGSMSTYLESTGEPISLQRIRMCLAEGQGGQPGRAARG